MFSTNRIIYNILIAIAIAWYGICMDTSISTVVLIVGVLGRCQTIKICMILSWIATEKMSRFLKKKCDYSAIALDHAFDLIR